MASLRDQLTSIYTQHKALTPELVVETARDKTHPLHDRFEWDNKTAGEAYRKVQAAELIRSVKVVYAEGNDGPKSVRAFTAYSRSDTPEHTGYAPTEELMENEFTRKLLLRECEREMRQFQRRFGHLTEYAEIVAKVMDDKAS